MHIMDVKCARIMNSSGIPDSQHLNKNILKGKVKSIITHIVFPVQLGQNRNKIEINKFVC